jgi:hypothetical protein
LVISICLAYPLLETIGDGHFALRVDELLPEAETLQRTPRNLRDETPALEILTATSRPETS